MSHVVTSPKRDRYPREPECPDAPIKKARVVPPLSAMAKECIAILSEGKFHENFWDTWGGIYVEDLVDMWNNNFVIDDRDRVGNPAELEERFKDALWKAVRQTMELMLFDGPRAKPMNKSRGDFPDNPTKHMEAHIWDSVYSCMQGTFKDCDYDLDDFDETLEPKYNDSNACERLQVYLQKNPRFRPGVSRGIVDRWIGVYKEFIDNN